MSRTDGGSELVPAGDAGGETSCLSGIRAVEAVPVARCGARFVDVQGCAGGRAAAPE